MRRTPTALAAATSSASDCSQSPRWQWVSTTAPSVAGRMSDSEVAALETGDREGDHRHGVDDHPRGDPGPGLLGPSERTELHHDIGEPVLVGREQEETLLVERLEGERVGREL